VDRPHRIVVLYNNDFGPDIVDGSGVDASSVELSARAILGALLEAGYAAELVGMQGLDVFEVVARIRAQRPDLVFNLCESMAGDPRNEPTFVGVLDLFGVPYTGADLLALASCLHKQRTKEILLARGISTPPSLYLTDPGALAAAEAAGTLAGLDYPWFVKLAHEDASVGITEHNVVRSARELAARAGALMREFTQGVLAERFVDGREINVTLLGNGATLRVLPLHEIDFAEMPAGRPRIVSYAGKWDESHVDYAGTKPVPLRDASAGLVAVVDACARGAWHALGLRDYGRVDLRVDAAGVPWVIDVNPNCDISPDAGVARAAQHAGLSYSALIDEIARAAWHRVRARPAPAPAAAPTRAP
jgi:D-alanine-D-alanine ligase